MKRHKVTSIAIARPNRFTGYGPADTLLSTDVLKDICTWKNICLYRRLQSGDKYYLLINNNKLSTLGQKNVTTIPIQITTTSGPDAYFYMLDGNAGSTQTVLGNGTATGYSVGLVPFV